MACIGFLKQRGNSHCFQPSLDETEFLKMYFSFHMSSGQEELNIVGKGRPIVLNRSGSAALHRNINKTLKNFILRAVYNCFTFAFNIQHYYEVIFVM